VDFYNDWINLLKHWMLNMGYEIDIIDQEKISFNFFNLQKRLVSTIPRKVLFSKDFSCPDHLQAGLNLVINKIEKGIDLTPHLSKNISKLIIMTHFLMTGAYTTYIRH
jgi:hypothetical protein